MSKKNGTTDVYEEPRKTKRQVLPYRFQLMSNGKLAIVKTTGQTLIVSQGEVENILLRDDLDAHRRKMYEAAKAEFQKPPSAKAVFPKMQEERPNLGEGGVQ